MLRHIVVFIYILGSFLGMTGIFLYWLMSKKMVLKNATELIRLKKFMISTFLTGLISFFTFYSQYIVFVKPSITAFRILDYLFWVCFIYYWIDYLDSMIEGSLLHKLKRVIQWGCYGYVLIWLFTTAQIWDISFYIETRSSRMLLVLLDILFCMLSLLLVALYMIRGQAQLKSRLSGGYVFAISTGLLVYSTWQFLNDLGPFAGPSAEAAWELNPLNATAFFLFFSNLITLFYVYHKDFAAYFLPEKQGDQGYRREEVPQRNQGDSHVLESCRNEAVPEQPSSAPEYATSEDIAMEHKLTPREKEVMEFVYRGFNNAEIADELYISQNTVKHHVYNLFKKLQVKNRIELICLLQEYFT